MPRSCTYMACCVASTRKPVLSPALLKRGLVIHISSIFSDEIAICRHCRISWLRLISVEADPGVTKQLLSLLN